MGWVRALDEGGDQRHELVKTQTSPSMKNHPASGDWQQNGSIVKTEKSENCSQSPTLCGGRGCLWGFQGLVPHFPKEKSHHDGALSVQLRSVDMAWLLQLQPLQTIIEKEKVKWKGIWGISWEKSIEYLVSESKVDAKKGFFCLFYVQMTSSS